MCFRAWSVYCGPGPGSSDVIRQMAVCASEKMETCEEVVVVVVVVVVVLTT